MTSSKNCASNEELAALIDGRVSEAERRRLMSHIDACPDCFSVFAETVRFGEESSGGKVVAGRFGRKTMIMSGLAVAASLLLLMQLRPISKRLPWAQPRLAASAELLSPLLEEAPPDVIADQVDVSGPLGFAPLSLEAREFRLGRLSVDLLVAARASDALRLDSLAAAAALLVADHPKTADQSSRWSSLRDRLRSGVPPAQLLTEIASLERGAERRLTGIHYPLGRWVESGRLALAVGKGDFLKEPQMRRFLEQAIDELEEESAARQQLAAIRRLTSGDRSQSPDRVQLTQAFSDLIALF